MSIGGGGQEAALLLALDGAVHHHACGTARSLLEDTRVESDPGPLEQIFIGNLPRFANSSSLTPLLAPYGQV